MFAWTLKFSSTVQQFCSWYDSFRVPNAVAVVLFWRMCLWFLHTFRSSIFQNRKFKHHIWLPLTFDMLNQRVWSNGALFIWCVDKLFNWKWEFKILQQVLPLYIPQLLLFTIACYSFVPLPATSLNNALHFGYSCVVISYWNQSSEIFCYSSSSSFPLVKEADFLYGNVFVCFWLVLILISVLIP